MKFYIHKLGCPKNDVDADYIAARLIADGHQPVNTPEKADSVIVNTCGFIHAAKEESIEEILRLGELKKSNDLKTIYAAGCLTQRYGDDMLKEIPELDGTFGHGALDSIAKAVGDSQHLTKTVKMETRKLGYLSWQNRFIADNWPYSYLKISDGCDRACSYCAIPGMRGRYRSRPLDSIIKEASFLAENGKKELILVSQEATLYGQDFKGDSNLVTLLKELDKIKDVEWIRLLYLHPVELTQELVEHIATPNKTLSYYDLPLQHIDTDLLSQMKRQVDRPTIERKLKMIHEIDQKAAIRTTFIVGFPGETEEQFTQLEEFVEKEEFDRMGVFPYSQEEETTAAVLADQIPDEVKTERVDRLMVLQQEIAFERNNSLIGTTQQVIIDSVNEPTKAIGRSYADCPEIDQEVHVISDGSLAVGDIVEVSIKAAEGYDLLAEPHKEV